MNQPRNSDWYIKGAEVGDEVLQHGLNHIEGYFKITSIDEDYIT